MATPTSKSNQCFWLAHRFLWEKAILSILNNYWGRAGKGYPKNICDFSPFFVFFYTIGFVDICWYATNNKDDEIGYSPLPGCLLPQYVLLWLSLPPSLRNSTHQYFSFLRRIIHNFTNQCSEDYFFFVDTSCLFDVNVHLSVLNCRDLGVKKYILDIFDQSAIFHVAIMVVNPTGAGSQYS